MNRIVDIIRSLPRAGKWMLLAVVVLVAYLLLIEPAVELQQALAYRADETQNELEVAHRRADGRASQRNDLLRGVELFGPIAFPAATRAEANEAISTRIVEILRSHGVTNFGRETRAESALGRDALADVIDPGTEVRRLVVDVEFVASPDKALAVIADLEGSPMIHALGRVHMRRHDDGSTRLRVNVSPETWFITDGRGAS